jgi:hypothetical protein
VLPVGRLYADAGQTGRLGAQMDRASSMSFPHRPRCISRCGEGSNPAKAHLIRDRRRRLMARAKRRTGGQVLTPGPTSMKRHIADVQSAEVLPAAVSPV